MHLPLPATVSSNTPRQGGAANIERSAAALELERKRTDACLPPRAGLLGGGRVHSATDCEVGQVGAGCDPCAAGQFGSVPGSNADCQPCAPGEFNEVPGATSCSECFPGQYSAEGARSCIGCPAGQTSDAGASTCTADADCQGDDSDGDGYAVHRGEPCWPAPLVCMLMHANEF